MNRIVVVGVSHRTAPVAVRERLALPPTRTRCLVAGVVSAGVADEAVALSTCNRTELYLACRDQPDLEREAMDELRAVAGEDEPLPDDAFYVHRGERAAVHLFRVAAGLDSLVPGEAEILGQVRDAVGLARQERTAGRVLARLFDAAIETGRRVRSETGIAETPASVGSVAATVARDALDGLQEATVLLVGAGKTAELTAVNLLARGATRVLVMNRTLGRAAALAERLDGEPIPMDQLAARLADADVVVSATNAPHAIVRAEDVARAVAGRPERPLVVIDLAVPRDVEPAVRELVGVTLHDIDDLERAVHRNRSRRAAHGEAAEPIVAEAAEEYRRWLAALDVVPAITGLHAHAERVRLEELARYDGRWESLSPRDRELLERLTRGIVAKLLHEPTLRMKDLALEPEGPDVAAVVAALFSRT